MMDTNVVLAGDCVNVLHTLPDCCMDAIVTDPPYGLSNREPSVPELVAFLTGARSLDTGGDFMGKRWSVPSVETWTECLRVLKPGGYLLSFGGTRTFDLISLGLRAAGFEYRDTLQWLYGQGFPKSLNIGKAIDKSKGAEREIVGTKPGKGGDNLNKLARPEGGDADGAKGCGAYGTGAKQIDIDIPVTAPATPEASQWEGWGTALKPAWEPILVFRKPLEGTVAANVLAHGTGALNIDGCRVSTDWNEPDRPASWAASGHSAKPEAEKIAAPPGVGVVPHPGGRWPTNAVFSHSASCQRVGERQVRTGTAYEPEAKQMERSIYSGTNTLGRTVGYGGADGTETVPVYDCAPDCPVRALDEQSGTRASGSGTVKRASGYGYEGNAAFGQESRPSGQEQIWYGDEGGASRFFPQFETEPGFCYTSKVSTAEATVEGRIENKHPTRKPLALMRWLVRLVCRPGGLVLDPYCGSGSTLVAAMEEGMKFVGIERDTEHVELSRARIAARLEKGVQTSLLWMEKKSP